MDDNVIPETADELMVLLLGEAIHNGPVLAAVGPNPD
jgi:hypothetical protein